MLLLNVYRKQLLGMATESVSRMRGSYFNLQALKKVAVRIQKSSSSLHPLRMV